MLYPASAELIHHEEAKKTPGSLCLPECDEVRSSDGCSPADHTSPMNSACTVTLNGSSSPISTLLEELLVMIFDDVITSVLSAYRCQRNDCPCWWLSSPRCLASVSRTWRAIVFACPMLWRHVHITPLQPLPSLKEQLRLSAPLPIHLLVGQWPFRSPTPASGPFSTVALTAQLQVILSPADKDDTLTPASQRVASIAINATESSTFLNFVLQTWTGLGTKFPALHDVTMHGNLRATWSHACFFDGRNAPALARLELSNVVIAHDAQRLPWGTGLNLTTLVWAAPLQKQCSLVLSVASFHRVIASFPNLTTLDLRGRVLALEFVTWQSLEAGGLTPLRHVRQLRVRGCAFQNASAAFVLFYLLPSLTRFSIHGRACSGPLALRTVAHALQALICLPTLFGWPMALTELEDLEVECVDAEDCADWSQWCQGELETWRRMRESMANETTARHVARVRVEMEFGEVPMETDETDSD